MFLVIFPAADTSHEGRVPSHDIGPSSQCQKNTKKKNTQKTVKNCSWGE